MQYHLALAADFGGCAFIEDSENTQILGKLICVLGTTDFCFTTRGFMLIEVCE